MRHILLIVLFLYACNLKNSKRQLDRYKITINGTPFTQAKADSVVADSFYYSRPNACYFLTCDTCRLLRENGIWKTEDADSLIFSSVTLTPQTTVEIDGKRVDSKVSLRQLQKQFESYRSNVLDWKGGKVFVLMTADNCELHFRFTGDNLHKIVYGMYGYH
jgi:hypothetical protein